MFTLCMHPYTGHTLELGGLLYEIGFSKELLALTAYLIP